MNTYAFIDASNLFYGGEKSLGFRIDYKKLLEYFVHKYQAKKVFYFGGVETHGMPFDYLSQDSVDLYSLRNHLNLILKSHGDNHDIHTSDAEIILLGRHLQTVKFFSKLEKFGYHLYLKPVKAYWDEREGFKKRKANCDVDMAFRLMLEKDNFDRIIVLSGDGDFLSVLKYLKEVGKEVLIFARGERTAREIKQFAGNKFLDFTKLGVKLRL